jgi:hypothetical protein
MRVAHHVQALPAWHRRLPAVADEQYGPTTELADIVPKFVCGECGAQMANVEPMMR